MAHPQDWREVKDPHKRKILKALDDSRWDFRTVGGLAKATRMPCEYCAAVSSASCSSTGCNSARINVEVVVSPEEILALPSNGTMESR